MNEGQGWYGYKTEVEVGSMDSVETTTTQDKNESLWGSEDFNQATPRIDTKVETTLIAKIPEDCHGIVGDDGTVTVVNYKTGATVDRYNIKDRIDDAMEDNHGPRFLPREEQPIRAQILQKGIDLTTGDRNKSYGSPHPNLTTFAHLVGSYLTGTGWTGPKLDSVDGSIIMVLAKISRVAVNKHHDDNYVDMATYGAIAGECAKILESQNES